MPNTDHNREPNRFRIARERIQSRRMPGRVMSRRELADECNAWLSDKPDPDSPITENTIAKIEQGRVTWPRLWRRAAYRHVLGVDSDAELGFEDRRRQPLARPTDDGRSIPAQPPDHYGEDIGRTSSVVHGEPAPQSLFSSPGAYERGQGVLRLPVRDANGVIAYVVTRPESLGAVTAVIPALGGLAEVQERAEIVSIHDADRFSLPGDAGSESSSFAAVTQILASQRQAIAPDALLSLVEAHRDTLSSLFRRATSDPVRLDIGAVLAETAIVASRLWSAMGNPSMALAHCAFARKLADRLDSPNLSAVARIFESNLHSGAATLIDADGDVVLGLRMLEEAAGLQDRLPQSAKARIAAEQAQAFAALDLRREALLALDRARRAAEKIDNAQRTGLFSDWTPTRLHVYEGTCLLLLGKTSQAAQKLATATMNMENDTANLNVALAANVDLASAYAAGGELEQGCSLLGSTHLQLIKLGNRRGIARAVRARDRLHRWRHEPAVRELDGLVVDAHAQRAALSSQPGDRIQHDGGIQGFDDDVRGVQR